MEVNSITQSVFTPAATASTNSAGSRQANDVLGKDDFLRILITQLQHQDPIAPVEDKEFISQMAQFSSLEQITNLSTQFSQLSQTLSTGQSLQLLGREVEISDSGNGAAVRGVVDSVTVGGEARVVVNSNSYRVDDITRILK